MVEWSQDRERNEVDEIRTRYSPWNLVPERQMNLETLRGEQDAHNKTSYSTWARDAKDYIKSRGKSGRLLVSTMEFAETLGDTPVTEGVLTKLGINETR